MRRKDVRKAKKILPEICLKTHSKNDPTLLFGYDYSLTRISSRVIIRKLLSDHFHKKANTLQKMAADFCLS